MEQNELQTYLNKNETKRKTSDSEDNRTEIILESIILYFMLNMKKNLKTILNL